MQDMQFLHILLKGHLYTDNRSGVGAPNLVNAGNNSGVFIGTKVIWYTEALYSGK